MLDQDPEVVGSPARWNPLFDHLPDAYLDILDAGGLVDDHLQVIKKELEEGDGRDHADLDLGEVEACWRGMGVTALTWAAAQ